MTQVRVVTLHKDTTSQGGTENKYYRGFVIDSEGYGLTQWGSARNGLTGGSYKALTAGETEKKLASKQRDGYVHVSEFYFDIDFAKVRTQTDAGAGKLLEFTMAGAAPRGTGHRPRNEPSSNRSNSATPAAPTPTPQAVVTDTYGALTDRLLDVITIATSDEDAALTQYQEIKAEIEQVDADNRKAHSYLESLEILLGIDN